MNALQEKPPSTTFEPPTAATRPFTRVLNLFCDEIKPAMKKHKVDRSVLDAIVRLLEGFHRSSIVITIAELAIRSGVSNSSVSAALARLEAQGLITRRRKLLQDRSRFIWELSLTSGYRVVEVNEPPRAPQPRAARPISAPPAPAAEPLPMPSSPEPTPTPAPDPAPPAIPPVAETRPTSNRHRPKIRQPELAADKPRRKPPELTAEQRQLVEVLRSARIDYWMACKLARTHAPEVIEQALANLRHRVGLVRNPAAWLVREIERGGYDPPPTSHDEQRQAERAARRERERQAEEQERGRAENAHQALLNRFAAMSPEEQAELERQVRSRLRRVSPRLADAAWDLTSPGPIRSQLLGLLGEDST